jgi:hypothetical protein
MLLEERSLLLQRGVRRLGNRVRRAGLDSYWLQSFGWRLGWNRHGCNGKGIDFEI